MAEETEVTIGGVVYKVPDGWTADQLRDYINNKTLPDMDGLEEYGAEPSDTPEIEIVDIPSISSLIPSEDYTGEIGVAETEIVLDYKKISSYIKRLRSALKRYAKFHKILWNMQEQCLAFPNGKFWDGIEISDQLSVVQRELAKLIDRKGYTTTAPAASDGKQIDKIKFGIKISEKTNITLEYIILVELACGAEERYDFNFSQLVKEGTSADDPAWKIHGLLASSDSPFNNPTILNYFINLREMDIKLRARSPMQWGDFLTKYTFPKVSSGNSEWEKYTKNIFAGIPELGGGLGFDTSKIKLNFLSNATSLKSRSDPGSNFNLSDAINFSFKGNMAASKRTRSGGSTGGVNTGGMGMFDFSYDGAFGRSSSGNSMSSLSGISGGFKLKNLVSKERANKIRTSIFNEERFSKSIIGFSPTIHLPKLLEKAYSNRGGFGIDIGGRAGGISFGDRGGREDRGEISADGAGDIIDGLWDNVLDKLKACGLLNLLFQAIESLMQNISLEDALGELLRAALENMSCEFLELMWDETPLNIKSLIDKDLFDKTGSVTKPWSDQYSAICSGIDKSNEYRRTLGKDEVQEFFEETIDTYVYSVLDAYKSENNMMGLLEELNKFPGQEIVAEVLTNVLFAIPPALSPPDNFLKSKNIPFCGGGRISMPELTNPFKTFPKSQDAMRSVMDMAQEKIEQLIAKTIISLMTKVMEAMTMASSMVDDLPSPENLTSIASAQISENAGKLNSLLQQAFSGQGQSLSADSLNQLKQNLFNASAAPDLSSTQESLSNLVDSHGGVSSLTQANLNNLTSSPQITSETYAANTSTAIDVSSMMDNVSSIITNKELVDLINGDAEPKTLAMIHQLVSMEHSEFSSMLPNTTAVAGLFKGIGNFIPLEMKQTLSNLLNDPIAAPADAPTDFNPSVRPCLSICPTQSQLEAFESIRCSLLKSVDSTITDDQCAKQIGKVKDQMISDLASLSDAAQKGFLNAAPGADASSIVGDACDSILPNPESSEEALTMAEEVSSEEAASSRDFLAQELIGWRGVLNYILSDTNGVPYTRHRFRAKVSPFYADIYNQSAVQSLFEALGDGFVKGYFPETVAIWLQNKLYEMADDDTTIFTNTLLSETTSYTDPTTGETTTTSPIKAPDVTFEFRDNNASSAGSLIDILPDIGGGDDSSFSYGFDIKYAECPLEFSAGQMPSAHIKVVEISDELLSQQKTIISEFDSAPSGVDPLISLMMGGIEDALNRFPADWIVGGSRVPRYAVLSSEDSSYSPQVQLFYQIVRDAWSDASYSAATTSDSFKTQVAGDYNSQYNSLISSLSTAISDNESAFLFGYEYEDIDRWSGDLDYVSGLDDAGERIPYDSELLPEEAKVLGQSVHERVHFLDPEKYGGKYSKPRFYISPKQKNGWLGIAEALVPEGDGTEPKRAADLLGLEQIKDSVDDLFRNLPSDPRVLLGPNAVEVPFARIMDRNAVASIQGNIRTTLRTFILEELIKGVPIFNKFQLPGCYDDVYIDYIISKLEEELKEQGRNRLTGKKDEQYWYAFLEQCVQMIGQQVADESITPSPELKDAISELNDVQESYSFACSSLDLQSAVDKEEEIFGNKITNSYLTSKKGLKKYRDLKQLESVQSVENTAKIVMKQLVRQEMSEVADSYYDMLGASGTSSPEGNKYDLGPNISDITKHFIGSSGMCLGSSLNIDLQEYTDPGDVWNVVSTINENVLDNALPDLGLLDFTAIAVNALASDDPIQYIKEEFAETFSTINALYQMYTNDKPQFVLEKYVYVEDPKKDIGIADTDYQHRGVVNLDTFTEFLDGLGDSVKEELVSDYFGDLSIVDAGILKHEGETTANAGHVHTYIMDSNGNGIAHAAYPSDNPSLRHIHQIKNGIIQSAYSPAAKEDHIHTVETEAVNRLEGSIGVRYGLRLCYIPTKDFVSEIESNSDDLASAEFLEYAALQKAYKLSGGILGVDAGVPQIKYMFPLVSVESDVFDETLGELAENLSSNYDMERMTLKLLSNPKFRLMFNHVFSLQRIMSLLAIYTTKAFLPSIGQGHSEVEFTPSSLYPEIPRFGEEADEPAERSKSLLQMYRSNDYAEWESYRSRMPVPPFIDSTFDRWDQDVFKDLKKNMRKSFLANYHSRDLDYKDPNDVADRLSRKMGRGFSGARKNISIPLLKRRSLISRPFNKFGEEGE